MPEFVRSPAQAGVSRLGRGSRNADGIRALLWHASRGQKLSELQRTNAQLYRAYLLKETLAQALDYKLPGHARRALEDWLSWASRSKLKPFVKAARIIRKHFDDIVA